MFDRRTLRFSGSNAKLRTMVANSFHALAINALRVDITHLFSLETLNWLAVRELDQVSVGVAQHREVPNAATNISRRLNKNAQLSSSFCNLLNLFPRVTLEAEMIHPGCDFSFSDYE